MMRLHVLLKLSLAALRREDETFLAYVYGKILDEDGNIHIKNHDAKWTGVFFQTLIFFRFLIVNTNLLSVHPKRAQVLFYAGTKNQIKSLIPTVVAMYDKGVECVAFFESRIACEEADSIACRSFVAFCPSVILVALYLFLVKAPFLYGRLRSSGNSVGIKKFFHCFCEAYAYIPYFIKLLDIIKPNFVIQSNDHNVANRCLRLVAEMQEIKTVYMQHASVTNLFPPLEFNYAFLDGEVALEEYIACQSGRTSGHRKSTISSNVMIFLSGQKKSIATSGPHDKDFCVGIGVNMMDEFDHLESLLNVFERKGVNCVVRTHPSQSVAFLSKLESYISQRKLVRLSDGKESSLSEFFGQCSILIAANTSLHLEAAIAGLQTYYYEFSETTQSPDYYGFVNSGLSAKLSTNIDLMTIEEVMDLSASVEGRTNAIRRFSDSFGTQWQNREGELVADSLIRLISGRSLSDIYIEDDKSNCFKSVYRIATQPEQAICR
jgi:hypothetical protein